MVQGLIGLDYLSGVCLIGECCHCTCQSVFTPTKSHSPLHTYFYSNLYFIEINLHIRVAGLEVYLGLLCHSHPDNKKNSFTARTQTLSETRMLQR